MEGSERFVWCDMESRTAGDDMPSCLVRARAGGGKCRWPLRKTQHRGPGPSSEDGIRDDGPCKDGWWWPIASRRIFFFAAG